VIGSAADRLERSGGRRVGTLAAEAVRIEAGEPRFGVDLDESALAHETGLVGESVSFTKGCYLGQELVSRIETRGHANRMLRGVVLAENLIPPPGAELATASGVIGAITSVAESLALRAPVALGLIRAEVEPGTTVRVRWEGGEAPAEVRELPLDDFVAS
jgi:folate-binding protein YgfZ